MDKRCFASFSIGSKKYYNIVYRYVVSMGASTTIRQTLTI